jgi:hypothetical protein
MVVQAPSWHEISPSGERHHDWIEVSDDTSLWGVPGMFPPLGYVETDAAPRLRNEADVTTAVAPSSASLSAADRCDRCGAQAYLRVELQSGGELLFCAHHAREHGDKLRQIAANVVDETTKLTTPTVAPDSDH